MEYRIRPVRADEWEKCRELRLVALQDPVAPIAFLESYEKALGEPDAFWQGRAAGATGDGAVLQLVAEEPDGGWAGTVTVLVERPGDPGPFGGEPEAPQTHLVGVFVRERARGSGLAGALFRAAVDWSWALGGETVRRVRLYVHEDNARAAAFYRRFGFAPSGATVPMPGDETKLELEYELPRPAGV
ncbi:GNAT family N-acetyltransferase [Streptomyces sp. NPDC001941]|uniref:GNAT family N-acetyltransferase n=1 Tax=Streptomyces sp. NPDC001941 TaxID=3154659 RepID=UPI003321D47D